MKLSRYLLRCLGFGYLISAAALLALFFVLDLVDEASNAGTGAYSMADAVLVVALKLPSRLVELSPIVSLLGISYALGFLGGNHELVAARAAGISSLQIAMICAVSLLIFYLVISAAEIGGRILYQNALLFRTLEISEGKGYFANRALWIADTAGMIRIGRYEVGATIEDIEIYDFGEGDRLRRHISAERLSIDGDGRWQLHDVLVKRFQVDNSETRAYEEFFWKPDADRSADFFDFPVESMALTDLNYQIATRRLSGEYSGVLELEFWKRCTLPLTGLVFGLFASAVGLREGERGALGRRIVTGVLAALILFLVHQLVLNIALTAGLAPLLAVTAPTIVIGALDGLMMTRTT